MPLPFTGRGNQEKVSFERCKVAVVGAGPYGLSVAAHLDRARALGDLRVFGEPMSFWRQNMPTGMWLRSPWSGSNLSDPHDGDLSDRAIHVLTTLTPAVR